jgi:hypothetical protein
LELLLQNNLVLPTPDKQLGKIYGSAVGRKTQTLLSGKTEKAEEVKSEDSLVLDDEANKEISNEFGVPELHVEVERALEQVGNSLAKSQKEKTS